VSRSVLGGALVLAALLKAAPVSAQFCPSYTASSVNNDNDCGVEAAQGDNPTPAGWSEIFDLVAQGPAAWGDAGPSVPDIGQGCGMPEPLHDVPARFPCEILKAIAMVESGWRQFCVPTTPADQEGGPSRTIISFDCGYGIGQVTSGMHVGETPSFDRERVAADPTYNLATGTRILAGKWAATQCVGDNQPSTVEHWYIATWAYNGLAYVNNPNNPNYDTERGVYDPAVNNAAPYQEKVFGRVEHPTNDLWPSVALAYPDPADCGSTGNPPALPEPACASPTDCVGTRATHATVCDGSGEGGGGGGGGGATGTGGAPGTGGAGAGGAGPAAGGATAAGGDAGGSGGDSGDGAENDDGCGCRVVGVDAKRGAGVGALLALGLAGAARRRRRA
jgi:MYXO-CTERM domain-containing protein